MSPFPDTSLVHRVQRIIAETFEVSAQEAERYAADLVALAEGWGDPILAEKLDWDYRIKKSLGWDQKLKWRSEEDQRRFAEAQKQRYAAYEALLSKRPERG